MAIGRVLKRVEAIDAGRTRAERDENMQLHSPSQNTGGRRSDERTHEPGGARGGGRARTTRTSFDISTLILSSTPSFLTAAGPIVWQPGATPVRSVRFVDAGVTRPREMSGQRTIAARRQTGKIQTERESCLLKAGVGDYSSGGGILSGSDSQGFLLVPSLWVSTY